MSKQLIMIMSFLLLCSCGVSQDTSTTSSKKSIECSSSLNTWHDTDSSGQMTFLESCNNNMIIGSEELILSIEAATYNFNIQNQNTLVITDKVYGDTLATLYNSDKSNSLFRSWAASETNENGITCEFRYDISENNIIISAKCDS